MSKAALVIDNNPNRCDECRLCKEVYGYIYVCSGVNRQIKDIRKIKKAKWCPLKEFPKKYPERDYTPRETKQYMEGYEDGYNACIDSIISK